MRVEWVEGLYSGSPRTVMSIENGVVHTDSGALPLCTEEEFPRIVASGELRVLPAEG